MSKFDATAVNADFQREIVDLARQMSKMEELAQYLERREYAHHAWPEGANWNPSAYDLKYANIIVTIPPLSGREWRGLKGTAGIVYNVRQYFGITKLERGLDYTGDTIFSGNFEVNGRVYWVRIDCDKQLPDTCKLVEEEVTELVTRKKYSTVCS